MNGALQCCEVLCCFSRRSGFLTLMPWHGSLEVTFAMITFPDHSFSKRLLFSGKCHLNKIILKDKEKPPAMKNILCRISNCYSIFPPYSSLSTLAIKKNHLLPVCKDIVSKFKWQQLKRLREHLRYIYYCLGFSKNVKKKDSFAQHSCMLVAEGKKGKML